MNELRVDIKKCTKCGAELPKTTEYFNKQGKYLASWCKQCTRNNNKEYRKINKRCSNKEYQREYRKSDNYKNWLKEYLKSDRRKGLLKKYANTDEHKEYQKNYKKSERYKEWMSEYIKSDKYKNSRKEYSKSDKQIEYRRSYRKEYKKSEKFKNLTLKVNTRQRLRRQLGQEPPKELLEAKIIHLKIKRLCATSEN